jgi:hypothetical protein
MQALLQAIATVQVRIQAHGSIYANSELQTRYGLIDPILRALEWDISNPEEVQVDSAASVPIIVNVPPSNAIPLSNLLQSMSRNKSFRPSAIYFPQDYNPIPIRYFNEIIKEVVLFLSNQNLIPQKGIPPIILPVGSTVVNQRRYTLLGAWLTCTHGSAPQVVQSAIRILKRCNINPASVYVS